MNNLKLLSETPWETRNLGVAAYALRDEMVENINADDLAIEMEQIKCGHEHSFVFARVQKSQLNQVPALQSCGFYMVECTVSPVIQFARNSLLSSFTEESARFIPARFEVAEIEFVTPAPETELAMIEDIARESFSDDRFHMDFRCPEGLADRRFAYWVQDLLANEAVQFDLLKVAGETAGFMARKENHLILAGFSRKFQRSGLGDFLWLSSCKVVNENGYRHADTLISINNLPVLNLYARLGFKFRDTRYSFHAWQ